MYTDAACICPQLSQVFPMNFHRGHASIVLALSASPGHQPEPEFVSLSNNVLPCFCSKYIAPSGLRVRAPCHKYPIVLKPQRDSTWGN